MWKKSYQFKHYFPSTAILKGVVWPLTLVLPWNSVLRGLPPVPEALKWCHRKWKLFSSGVNAGREIMWVTTYRINRNELILIPQFRTLKSRILPPPGPMASLFARSSITFSHKLSTLPRSMVPIGDKITNWHSKPESKYKYCGKWEFLSESFSLVQAVRGYSGFLNCRWHGGHGHRQPIGSQNDLLLCPRGLPHV